MKKKLVILTLSLLMAISVFTGCGKSDEEKARDEIMSHMDANEKAAIADDQKAMADYEAEKQAQADAIANEKPIDYSEVLEERELDSIIFDNCSLVKVPVSVLLPSDDYLYNGNGYDIEKTVARGMYYYGQNQPAVYSIFSAISASSMNDAAEDCGNYTIYMQPDSLNTGINYLFVAEKNSDYALQISYVGSIEDYYDCAKAILNKNYEHIKEQLQ